MDELINKMNKIVINKNKNILKYNRKLKYDKLMRIKINKLNHQINKLGDTNLLLTQKLLLKIGKINNILLKNNCLC